MKLLLIIGLISLYIQLCPLVAQACILSYCSSVDSLRYPSMQGAGSIAQWSMRQGSIWPGPTHITHSKAVLLYSLLPVPLFCRSVTSHMILILSFLVAMRVGLNDGWYISDTGDTGVSGQLWSSTLKAVKHILDRNLATGGEQQIWSSAIRPRLCFTPF